MYIPKRVKPSRWPSITDSNRTGSQSTPVSSATSFTAISDGRAFFVGEPDAGYLRLSFSMLDEDLLVEGARRLRTSLM